MKVTIINGNARHGSTWHCKELLKEALGRYETVETTEYTLPKDMPHFCNGCFSCFYNGEGTCPHAASVQPITSAILNADVVILTSPVYALDVTGGLKALLDHLCYMWMSHRPDPRMFNKTGVTICTTAGMGLGHASKTMRNSLKFWGVKRLYSFKGRVSAMKWSDIPAGKQEEVKKDMEKLAKQVATDLQHIEKLPAPLFRRLVFKGISGMMKKNTWNERDRKHWEDNNWI